MLPNITGSRQRTCFKNDGLSSQGSYKTIAGPTPVPQRRVHGEPCWSLAGPILWAISQGTIWLIFLCLAPISLFPGRLPWSFLVFANYFFFESIVHKTYPVHSALTTYCRVMCETMSCASYFALCNSVWVHVSTHRDIYLHVLSEQLLNFLEVEIICNLSSK